MIADEYRRSSSRSLVQSGLTLLELLISLAIGVLLAGALIAVLTGSISTYRIQFGHARVFENARFAMRLLARDIRMAGFFGCVTGTGDIVNNLDAASGSLYDSTAFLEGFQNDGVEDTWRPSGYDVDELDVMAGSDGITLRFANPAIASPVATWSDADGPVYTADGEDVFESGRIVVVSDCDKADVFQITGFDAGGGLEHDAASGASPGNSSAVLGGALGLDSGYDGDGGSSSAVVMEYHAVRYFVRKRDPSDASANAAVALYRQYVSGSGGIVMEDLVEGVENLQLLYGVDDDEDGVAESYVSADAVGEWRNVVSVQVALLVRSGEEYGTASDSAEETYTLLDEVITDADGLRVRRHQFATTVELRNRW